MKRLNKAIIVISKIAEVCFWVGTAFSTLIAIVMMIGKNGALKYLTDMDLNSTNLSIEGVSIDLTAGTLENALSVVVIAFITLVIICTLMAMVFRNLYLIFKTSEGQTKFSKGTTPFQPDNIRMVREIGIFLIAKPIVEIISGVIMEVLLSTGDIHINVGMTEILIGLVVLALSQYFAYGMELENDVDGLL